MSQVQSNGGSAVRELAAAVEPEVDVLETAEGYTIVADVPGVARESLEVEYEESVLRLRGSGRSALARSASSVRSVWATMWTSSVRRRRWSLALRRLCCRSRSVLGRGGSRFRSAD